MANFFNVLSNNLNNSINDVVNDIVEIANKSESAERSLKINSKRMKIFK